MKTPDQYFADWECHVFGFGYGSGEEHVLSALKSFMDAAPGEGGYDYRTLEGVVGPTVAWLLINILCGADILEYGTSPRFGWLTPQGRALKAYLAGKTLEELGAALEYDEHCAPTYCNCDGEPCHNPLWVERRGV